MMQSGVREVNAFLAWGTAALGCPAPLGATEYSPGRKPWVAEETGPSATPQAERHFRLSDQQRIM